MVVYVFNKEENQELMEKVYNNVGEVFGVLVEKENMSLYEYVYMVIEDYIFKSVYDEKKWEDYDVNKVFYCDKFIYGLL